MNLNDIKPGATIETQYRQSGYNRTLEVRAIVDEEFIAVRYWKDDLQIWIYAVEHLNYFKLLDEHGCLTLRKGKN